MLERFLYEAKFIFLMEAFPSLEEILDNEFVIKKNLIPSSTTFRAFFVVIRMSFVVLFLQVNN